MAKVEKKSKRAGKQKSKNTSEVVLRLRHTSGVKLKKVKMWMKEKTVHWGSPAGLVLIIFLILLSLFLPKNQFQQAKEKLAQNPNDFEAHLILAEEYLKNNQLEEAEKELLLAKKIEGLNYQTKELWQKIQESNPEDIRQLIEYWEKVVSEKPDYRDAYLQLALLHYKLYQNDTASGYLQKALNLDPNFEPAREMEEKLSLPAGRQVIE